MAELSEPLLVDRPLPLPAKDQQLTIPPLPQGSTKSRDDVSGLHFVS